MTLWTRGVVVLLVSAVMVAALSVTVALSAVGATYHIYLDRHNLPDLGPFTRFEFPTIGHVYDTNGQPLVELAREYRQIIQYQDIPPIVRDAILATEDKHFFSHSGVDYLCIPRVLGKVRVGALIRRLVTAGRHDNTSGRAIFPQGGSTITQQLVRGDFLQRQTSQENSYQLRNVGLVPRALSSVIGARNVNAEYYFGRRLSTFTADDADKAALLAGIAKSPREYAPTAIDTGPILRRRNQVLALMAGQGFISHDQMTRAERRPLPGGAQHPAEPLPSSAVVEHVLDELRTSHADLGIDDLLQGRIQVYSTVDARVQRIVSDALEHGLDRYEQRHPRARGQVQGSSDFNRVRKSLRQPGSTMKPIVYLAAFQHGDFSLETLVPDEPIQVPNGSAGAEKWISNYDGLFKGLIPIREALAESRNAVAVWITTQIGIDAVLRTSRSLGVQTPLQRFATTALGASEVNLLELATAYRTIASGVLAQPYVIRQIVRDSGEVVGEVEHRRPPTPMANRALSLIQEGLRGVVRIPTGTAHALDSRGFPIAVMGKTGTTNEFRDALFVGSTYGVDGIMEQRITSYLQGRDAGIE